MRKKHSNAPARGRTGAAGVPLIAGFLPVTEVDVPVRRLVRRLNRLPGCSTISSCGGHPEPTGSQVPDGRFSVDLELAPTRAGWRSLEVLAWLCGEGTETVLTPWSEGPGSGVRFNLQGSHLSGLTLEVNLGEYFYRRLRGRGG